MTNVDIAVTFTGTYTDSYVVNGALPANGDSPETVGGAVARILASEAFANSKRLRRFLAYVVEKTLAGQVDDVKEYNIALAVFDRDESFDPRMDSIVRVEARRLRHQLTAYYQGEGRLDPVIIELPRGAYVPVFRKAEAPPEVAEPAANVRRVAAFCIAGLIVAIVGLLVWKSGWIQASRTPHHWVVEGSRLKVLDAHDRPCWERQFPAFHGDYDVFVRDKALIEDIDGDGHPEVLFTVHPESQGENSDSLLCFDHRGNVRWEFRFGGRKTFGGRTFDASYAGRFLRKVRNGTSSYILTAACHKIWHPAQVALLDPKTGGVREEYWHPGSIYYLVLQDVDGDGREEVLLGTINNPGPGLGHAGLAVLKIPFSERRQSPPSSSDLAAITGGGEIAYALFPIPDVARVMGRLPIITRFAVDQNQRIVVQTPLPEEGGIVYYLDFNLQVVEVRASDHFGPLHERYYRQGLLEHRLSETETASLGQVLRFPAAPDGNSPILEKLWAEQGRARLQE